jgi:hypothetical protein
MKNNQYLIAANIDPIIIKKNDIIYKNLSGEYININKTQLQSYKNIENNIINKNYTLNIKNSDPIDETSEQEKIILTSNNNKLSNSNDSINMIYNSPENILYNTFYLSNNNNNIFCEGLNKTNELSYNLILNHYIGICLHVETDINQYNTKGKTYIFYSKYIKEHKFITLKNYELYTLKKSNLLYYPMYVMCCDNTHDISSFIDIYPYLIKNIFT